MSTGEQPAVQPLSVEDWERAAEPHRPVMRATNIVAADGTRSRGSVHFCRQCGALWPCNTARWRATCEEMRAERDAALALLRGREFGDAEEPGACRDCGRYQDQGHAADCALGLAECQP